MGAEGFATFTWEGWLFGIMLLKKPWGPPEFTSYISLPSLWSVVLLAIQGFGMYLVVPNITVFNTPVTNNALVSYINPATMLAVYLINILTRIIFITGAKDIAKVLNHFYSYKSPQNEGSTRRGWLWLYAMKILTLLIALVYAGTTFELYSGPLREDPQFGRVVGKVPGVIIGATTFFLTEVPALLGFFLVASTVLHLMEEYQDFCTALQDEVSNRASCSISIFGDDRKKRNPLVDETLSQYYLKKLDDLEGLFEAADVFLSPLSLLLVTGSVVLLIPIAYAVASMDADTPTKTVLLKTTLILQFIRYSILLITVRVGEYAKNVVLKTREALKEVRLLQKLEDEALFVERKHYHALDVLKLAIDFDWRLSAGGFFDVGVQLLSGIMTAAVSYIIILIQLQITFDTGK